MLRLFKLIILTSFLAAMAAGSAFAAAYTWDGGGADNNWSTTGNWSPDGTPGASDTVAFDGTSTKNSTIDASFAGSVAGISINAGYTGVITQNRSLTIGASNFSQSAGTFTGGSAAIDLNGNFTLAGGTFTSTSGNLNVSGNWTHTAGGTFNHNSGTVIADGWNPTWNFESTIAGGNSGVFYNFQCTIGSNQTLTITSGDTLVVQNNLTLTEGLISTDALQVSGNVTVGANYDGGTSLLTFSGGNNQSFTLTGATGLYNGNITINKTAGTVTLASALVLDASGQDLTITSGTLEIGTYSLTVNDDLTLNGGTLSNSGSNTITIGDWIQSSGTFNGQNSTLDFTTFTLSGGTFTSTSGNLNVSGNWTHTAGGTFNHNSGTVIADGWSPTWNFESTIAGGNSGVFYDFQCTIGSNQTLTITSGDTLVVQNNLTLTEGLISTGALQVSGNVTVGANYDGGTSLLTFSGGNNQSFTLTGATGLYDADITINKTGGTVTLASALVMDAASQDLTLTAGTFDLANNNLQVNGTSGTFTVASGAVFQLTGSETVTLNASNPTLSSGSTVTYNPSSGTSTMKNYTYSNLTINASGATVELGAAETVNNLTITAGTFYTAGNGLIVSSAFNNTGVFRLKGNESITLSMDTDSGIVEFIGDGDGAADTYIVTSLSATYNKLKINSTDGATDLFRLGADLDVNNDLTITSGNLDVSTTNYGITVGASWAKAGTFTRRSGTVTFDTTAEISVISGNTTFNNFTCVTAGKILDFTAGKTQTIAGTLTLTGTSTPITLESTAAGSQWGFVLNGTASNDYLHVKDSDASSGTQINAGKHSTSLGNNLNWEFNDAPTAASLSGTQAADGTGNVTFSFIIDDADDDNTCRAKIEYYDGSTWKDPTFSESASNVTATYTPKPDVENDNSYQAGSVTPILTSSGSNTVTVQWASKTDESALSTNSAKVRVTPNDTYLDGSVATSGAFTVDNVAPASLANLAATAYNSSSVTLGWTAASDTNFNHYEIWFGTNSSEVVNRNGTAIEWDNSDDAALATASTASTTITGLTAGTTYYFKIWAVDSYGNETTKPGGLSTLAQATTQAPTVTINSVTQSQNGDGKITINLTVNDGDGDTSCQVKLRKYNGSAWGDPTLSTLSQGSLNNANEYQISGINTSGGAQTFSVSWESVTDDATLNVSTAKIGATVKDTYDTASAEVQSSNFVVDNVDPTGPSNLAEASKTASSISLSWTAATDTNNSGGAAHYEIWYGTSSSEVQNRNGAATEWDNDNDGNLAGLAATSTTVTGLTTATYFLEIWGVDKYGNETSNGPISVVMNTAPTVGFSADDIIPAAQISQAVDGTGVVTIQFKLKDAQADNCTLNTFQSSTNEGSSWGAPANGDASAALSSGWTNKSGSNYSSATGWTGTTHSFTFNTKHANVSGINGTDQSDLKVRFKANDGMADSAYGTSASFEVDDLAPAVATAIVFHTTPEAGNSSIGLDATWTEVHPNTNTFGYNLNAAGYITGEGETNTATPTTKSFTLSSTLDGNDYFSAIKCVQVDDFGNLATSESATARYIKPYTPAAPTVANATGSTVTVSVNKHASETTGLSYAIYETSTNKYVQANGTLGVSSVWQTDTAWGSITVSGLAQPGNNYTFKTKSRNSSDNTTESDLSSSSATANTPPALLGKDGAANILAQELTDGTNQVTIEYQVADSQQSSVTITPFYKKGVSGTWTSIAAYCTGDSGTVATGTANRSITWNLPVQLGNISGSDYFIRLIANDGQAENSTATNETSSAITLDTTAPSSCSVSINEGAITNTRNLHLTLAALGATRMYISGNISADASTFQWISFETSAVVVLTDTNGTKEVAAQFKDGFGNSSATVSATSVLDTAAPLIQISRPGSGEYRYGSAEVAGTVSDPVAGVSGAQLKITKLPGTLLVDWSALTLSGGAFLYNFVIPASNPDGTQYQIEVRATDLANNTAEPENITLTKLATAPTVSTLSFAQGNYASTTGVTLNLVAPGAYQMYLDGDIIDDSNTKEWIAAANPKNVTLASGNGSKTVSLRVRNLALTESASTAATIILDTTVPTLTLYSPTQSAEVKSIFTVIGIASDETSGVLSAEIKAVDALSSATLLDWTAMNVSGNGPYSIEKSIAVSAADNTAVTLLVKATDRALNVSNLAQSGVVIDIATPEVFDPVIVGVGTISTRETYYLSSAEVTFSGSGEPGVTISIEAGLPAASLQFLSFSGDNITWQNLGTATIGSSSLYSLTVTIPSNIRYLRIGFSDSAGNSGSKTYTTNYDSSNPTITGVLLDGKTALSGNYINPQPEISATLSDDLAINANSIAIKLNGILITDGNDTSGRYDSWNAATGKVIYTVKNTLSAEADHSMAINVSDEAGSPATQFSVTGLRVSGGSVNVAGTALAYPTIFNPGSQSTKLTYTLTDNADITIRIYNISAQMIWQRKFVSGSEGGKTGYNEVTWNGISDFGSIVPNGVYIANLLAPANGYKVLGKIKIIVLR